MFNLNIYPYSEATVSDFNFTSTPAADRTRKFAPRSPVVVWLLHASATFAGALLAGLVLMLIVRWYMIQSVRSILAKPTEEIRKIR